MALMYPAGFTFLDSNGNPVASGSVAFYSTGTQTLKAIYTDKDLTIAATNPFDLDASGRFSQNLYGSGDYSVECFNSADVSVFSFDDVFGIEPADVAEVTRLPATDNAVNLGSGAKRYANLYSVNVSATSVTTTTMTATGAVSGSDITASGKVLVGTTRQVVSGTGSPESSVTAPMGSLYLRTDGASDTTLYVKTSGSGNTGWQAVYTNVLTTSTTWDVGSLADGAGETKSGITVTGAALGDFVDASLSVDIQGMILTAWVSSANTVAARIQNETGSGPIDLASATLRIRVRKA
jgi:hypothetical protein